MSGYSADLIRRLLSGRIGLEVGGPSLLFTAAFPIYSVASRVDAVNYENETIWTDTAPEGAKIGTTYIAEATKLVQLKSETYDFVASSNCLEHVANPIKALVEWRRVLRRAGLLILVLPDKASNFDHRRPVTTLDHLVNDYLNDVGEDDLTHLDEILALHDLARDPHAGNRDQFLARSLRNVENRALHHHVFDQQLIVRMLSFVNFEVMHVLKSGDDICCIAAARV